VQQSGSNLAFHTHVLDELGRTVFIALCSFRVPCRPQTQQQQQQQAGALAAFGAPLQPDLAAVREIEALKDAFAGGPGHPRFRFACLLLNVVDHPASRVKPPGGFLCF